MPLLLPKIVGCALLLLLTINSSSYAYRVKDEGIQSGVYNAGPLGNHAGRLIGAEAVSQLQHTQFSGDAEETHDFSSSGGDVETLGTTGDHLDEQHFPADYGGGDSGGDVDSAEDHGATSAEAYEGAESAHTQQHEALAQSGYEDGNEHLEKYDVQGNYQHHDFHSQPIVGIDHGKGAFSYSTLYEHKHDEQKEYGY